MSLAHLASVDLNLLVALAALLEEGNVTRAARRVGLTQPAMSHALARLRTLLDDPLFIRSPRGVLPTPRAAELAEPLARVLADVEGALLRRTRFDPATTRRTFSMAAADYALLGLLPPLERALRERSPGSDLFSRPAGAELEHELESGAVELALAPTVPPAASLRRQRLFEERFVCIVRQGHPQVKRRLTLERWLALSHVLVAPRGTPGGSVDRQLARRGLSRRVAVTVPSFLVAPFVVAESDLVLTCPERLARAFAPLLPLVELPPPIEIPGFTVWQMWHERVQADPAHAWFRQLVAEVAREL